MSQTTAQLIERGGNALIGNYARLPVVMERGQGSHLWDADGKQYVDLFAGFGAAILGHCHPRLIEAAAKQAQQLWHVGNTFWTEPQIEMAERLQKTAFDGRAFFCHSGLEANEAAVKLARLYGHSVDAKRWKVISMNRSFHGRSLAMIAATGNPAIKAGFEPAVPGFTHVDLGDLEGLSAAADNETAGIIIEPIQGEGGVYPADIGFISEVRRLCDERKIALIFDEVWTGCGRTGRWFAHQHLRTADGRIIEPDIMTLGKAMGGGLPVGVMWAKPRVAALMVPGKHGCTLGANPICMSVASAIFDVIGEQRLTEHAATMGEYGMARLKNDKRIAGKISGVRGHGMMIGIELKEEPAKLVEKGLEHGAVINLTAKKVIRLAPPINITREDWDRGLELVVETIGALLTHGQSMFTTSEEIRRTKFE